MDLADFPPPPPPEDNGMPDEERSLTRVVLMKLAVNPSVYANILLCLGSLS